MAISHMLANSKKLISTIFVLALLLIPAVAHASTYGSGGYGDCPYGDYCASSSNSSTSTTGSSSNNPAATGGSSSTSSSGDQILLNDFDEYFTSSGKQISLKAKQVVYFETTENSKTIKHSVTITSVGKDYVDIKIASDPITDRLYVNDFNKYDVNRDGTDDIEVALNSITGGVADISFRSLIDTNSVSSPQAGTGEIFGGQTTWRTKIPLALYSLLTIVGIGILVFLAVRRRKNKQQ